MNTSPVAKLYYFNPNSYSTEWFVTAYSRDEAIAAVRAHILADVEQETFYADVVEPGDKNDPEYLPQSAEEKRTERIADKLWRLDQYVTATRWPHSPRNPAPCIEEHPIGHVVQTAIS